MADKMITRSDFLSYIQAFEARLDTRVGAVVHRLNLADQRFHQMDQRVDGFEKRMRAQFDETRNLIRLSLAELKVLRETSDRGVDDDRRDSRADKVMPKAKPTRAKSSVKRSQKDGAAARSR